MSSADQPPVIKPGRGHDCLLTNLLVLPGLGSLMGGRKVGWLQIMLALVGFVLTPSYFIGIAKHWIRTGQYTCEFNRYLLLSFLGLLLFLGAWGWGLATGLAIRRASRPQ
jgi:hypothetical protein